MKKQTVQHPEGLMAKLAKSLKVDFRQLQETGKISPKAVSRMQGHCGACSEPGACDRMLNNADKEITEPPKFCPNRNIFLMLKKIGQKRRLKF